MTKKMLLIIGFLLIVGIGGLVYYQTSREPAQTTEAEVGNTQTNEGVAAAEVAQHNGASSCWSSINGNVYDLTSWIPQHPGGPQAILQLCGTDGSAKFNAQHGGAAKQATILAGFKIGTLSQ